MKGILKQLKKQRINLVNVSEKRFVTYKPKVAYQDILKMPNIDKYRYRVNQA